MKRQAMQINIKRVYEPPADSDGLRVLVDRLWPRGLSKEKARIDLWAKEVSPSNELRRWYGHDPAKWDEFKGRYFDELQGQRDRVTELTARALKGPVTFLFSSKEREINNAAALREYILAQQGRDADYLSSH